jgi:large subunit ribosomal protein L5
MADKEKKVVPIEEAKADVKKAPEKKEKPAKEEKAEKSAPKSIPRLKKKYKEEAVPALMKKFNYKSVMEVPRVEKIIVNVGCGDARDNAKALEAVVKDISIITGQKAVITKARKSVANFKLREGMSVGVKVTLRQVKMWGFLDRLLNVALPRVRDFRGISANAFDGRGNYALGLKEQLVFPEIDYDKIEKIRGMDIVICTTAKTDEEARELLTCLGAPFIQS